MQKSTVIFIFLALVACVLVFFTPKLWFDYQTNEIETHFTNTGQCLADSDVANFPFGLTEYRRTSDTNCQYQITVWGTYTMLWCDIDICFEDTGGGL